MGVWVQKKCDLPVGAVVACTAFERILLTGRSAKNALGEIGRQLLGPSIGMLL